MARYLAVSRLAPLAVALSILLIALIASDVLAHGVADAVDLLLCVGTVGGIVVVVASRRNRAASRVENLSDPLLQGSVKLGLYLSPVILLSVVFPIASHRIAHATLGGAPLTSLLLAASLTVPWLSQTVCLPLYRGIGDLVRNGSRAEIEHRLCEVWPVTFLQSLGALVVFAIPVELATHWSLETMGAYLLLCAIYVAFSQSLIIVIVEKRRVLWAVGWTLFAAALLFFPTVWFLPPLVGLVTQLVPLRRQLRAMLRPIVMDWRDIAGDLFRGFLLGSVLWCDKLFFFLRAGSHMPVVDVFLALLPAILAYNYYFVRLAPGFDIHVTRMRTAMERDTHRGLASASQQLAQAVEISIARTGLTGAVLSLMVISIIGVVQPAALGLVATITAASWLFMMTTVLCYKLDYIGDRARALTIGGVHLAACALAFVFFYPGIPAYAALIVAEGTLFVFSLRTCLAAWKTAEYQLFWSRATAW